MYMGVDDVRPRKIHTPKPRAPELSASDFEMAIEKLKIYDHQVFIKSQQN